MACVSCKEDITDGDVSCGACQNWMHFGCAGVTETAYRTMTKTKKGNMRCLICKSGGTSVTESPTLSDIMAEIRRNSTDLKAEINKASKGIDDLKGKFSKLEANFKGMDTRLKSVEAKVSSITLSQEELEQRVSSLLQQNNDRHQFSRINNIEISGVATKKGENLYSILSNLCVKVGITLTQTDVDTIHRVRRYPGMTGIEDPSSNASRPPAIVVRFTQRRRKDEFLAAVRSRRGLNTGDLGFTGPVSDIFVSEHLTPANKQLLRRAKIVKSELVYNFLWVRDESRGQEEGGGVALAVRRGLRASRRDWRAAARHEEIWATLWGFALYLVLHAPSMESRVDELEQAALKYREQPQASTKAPEPPRHEQKAGQCFHMEREDCPTGPIKCKRVGAVSVFCCDVDSFRLKEGLAVTMTQNVTNLHVLNANIDELDISQAVYRRLGSMALTDGNIGKITVDEVDYEWERNDTSQFPKYSSIACLNISNNNLTSAKLQPSITRPFAYLFNLSVLDASANNLTEFPLSLVQSNRKISVDFSGNKYLPCKHFQRAMESNNSSLVTFDNYNKTYCALDLTFNWFKDVQIVQIDHLRVQRELNASCRNIKPSNINCTCIAERLELLAGEVTNLVAVDCSLRHLKEMPTDLPPNTVKLNVSYNNITSLEAVGDDPTYEHLRQLIVDYNDIQNIVELEGTKFIDNFMLFSISHNKLKTIHTYVLSNKFEAIGPYTTFAIAGNYIHCDCNTEKVLKPWLVENFKNIPDYKSLECMDGMGPVVDLVEFQVCHTPRDWTDYIYYIIGLEVLTLVLLISKVSYDYWIFKTAGYLPWPANKMPRLPCDWLCE